MNSCCNCCDPLPQTPSLPLLGNVAGSYVIISDWIVPACNQTAVVILPNVDYIPLNTYIYTAAYGYFQITAVNYLTREVTLRNPCTPGLNAPAGTLVPANSLFILTAAPFISGVQDFKSSLALVSGNPSMTVSSVVVGHAYYQIDNIKCFIHFQAAFTVSGTPYQVIKFNLPIDSDSIIQPHLTLYAVGGDGVQSPAAYAAVEPTTTPQNTRGALVFSNSVGWAAGSQALAILHGWYYISKSLYLNPTGTNTGGSSF